MKRALPIVLALVVGLAVGWLARGGKGEPAKAPPPAEAPFTVSVREPGQPVRAYKVVRSAPSLEGSGEDAPGLTRFVISRPGAGEVLFAEPGMRQPGE